MKDRQGVFRIACTKCGCKEYSFDGQSDVCSYCGHYPVEHLEEKEPETIYTDCVDQLGTAPAAQGTFVSSPFRSKNIYESFCCASYTMHSDQQGSLE